MIPPIVSHTSNAFHASRAIALAGIEIKVVRTTDAGTKIKVAKNDVYADQSRLHGCTIIHDTED